MRIIQPMSLPAQLPLEEEDNPFSLRLILPRTPCGVVVVMAAGGWTAWGRDAVVESLLDRGLAALQVLPGTRLGQEPDGSGDLRRISAQWICTMAAQLARQIGTGLPLGVLGGNWGASLALEAAADCPQVRAAVVMDAGLDIAEPNLEAVEAPTLFIAPGPEEGGDPEFYQAVAGAMRSRSQVASSSKPGEMAASWFMEHFRPAAGEN